MMKKHAITSVLLVQNMDQIVVKCAEIPKWLISSENYIENTNKCNI